MKKVISKCGLYLLSPTQEVTGINYDPPKTEHGFMAGDEVRYVGVYEPLEGAIGVCTGRGSGLRVGVRYSESGTHESKPGRNPFGATPLYGGQRMAFSTTKEEAWLADSCELVVTDDPGDPRAKFVGFLAAEMEEYWRERYAAGSETSLYSWGETSFNLALKKGFHRDIDPGQGQHMEPERIASRIALITSELSEALEEVGRGRMELYFKDADNLQDRNEYLTNNGALKPEGFGIELADVFLRLVDLAYSTGIDLDKMVRLKHNYNKTRPFMHGGKKL
jgi:NTP pyrophosphatase (non-canonical NTP hydrolase)